MPIKEDPQIDLSSEHISSNGPYGGGGFGSGRKNYI